MALVVQKYGGTSVGDASRIRRVAERVVASRHAGNDVVVVVSAMGDTTDDLIALARRSASAGSTLRMWKASRWALLGPIPGSRPSSSIRSWTGPSYIG